MSIQIGFEGGEKRMFHTGPQTNTVVIGHDEYETIPFNITKCYRYLQQRIKFEKIFIQHVERLLL